MDWRDKAACLTADPELFFPVGNTGPAVDQIEKAKAGVTVTALGVLLPVPGAAPPTWMTRRCGRVGS